MQPHSASVQIQPISGTISTKAIQPFRFRSCQRFIVAADMIQHVGINSITMKMPNSPGGISTPKIAVVGNKIA